MLSLQLNTNDEQAIRAHGQRAFPQECCGFLLGRDDVDVRRIVRVVPAVNDRGEEEKHNRFTISPEAFLHADRAARSTQLDILGFYHSHPNSPAKPSLYDLEHAWPVYSYIIVSVSDGDPAEMTCWVLDNDRSKFNRQKLTIG